MALAMRLAAGLALAAAFACPSAPAQGKSAASAPSVGKCLAISSTHGGDSGYYRVRNRCGYDVVVFYCLVTSIPPTDEEAGARDCRRQENQRVIPNPALSRLGDAWTPAPASLQEAIDANQRLFDQEAGNSAGNYYHTAASTQVTLLQSSPIAFYTLPSGAIWESGEFAWTAYAFDQRYRSHLFVSSCAAAKYLSGACEPDAIAAWRRAGGPQTPEAAERRAPY